MRLNVGSAGAITPGWTNVDSSPSVWFSSHLQLAKLLRFIGLIEGEQWKLIQSGRNHHIVWANATRRLPFDDASVEVIYSCHMLEHLDATEVQQCLKEFMRLLKPGGILRLALPDLRFHIDKYLKTGDADAFINGTLLGRAKPRTLKGHLLRAVLGDRISHSWMYDGQSLVHLLTNSGFANARCLSPGETMIDHAGELNLFERAEESVYVEALKSE
jgi:predicted SAM-dependent methyltransferase